MLRFALVLMFVASPAHADDTRARLANDVAAARTALVQLRTELERELRTVEGELAGARRLRAHAIAAGEAELRAARAALEVSESRPAERGRKLELLARPVTRELASRFAMDAPRGCLVAKIKKTGGGYHAGLRAGDVVLSFDGRAVSSPQMLSAQVADASRDRKIYVEIWRHRGVHIVTLPALGHERSRNGRARFEAANRELSRLRQAHGATIDQATGRIDKLRQEFGARLLTAENNLTTRQSALRNYERARFGVKMSSVTNEVRRYYGVRGGAFVEAVEAGSRAQEFGLARGDIIVRYGDARVDDARHLSSLIKKQTGVSTVEVVRDGDRRILYADGRAETQELATVAVPPIPKTRVESARPARPTPHESDNVSVPSSKVAAAPRPEPRIEPAPRRQRRGRPPPRPSNTHLFPTLAFNRESTPSADTHIPAEPQSASIEIPASAEVPANHSIDAAYQQTETWKYVFANLEEFLGWHAAHGQPSRLLSHTAFDFHDAVDGGRVRTGGHDQECYLFDRPEPFARFTVNDTRSYYNVKCHDEQTFAF